MSELIRHLRHGGPAALAAAKTLLESKPKLTAAEVAEVKLLLPTLQDLFGKKLSEGLSTLLSGLEVAVPVPLESLMPRLEHVKEPQLPGRFGTDLQLVRPQLVNHPALSREQKAERLFAFLVPFVVKLVKLPREQRAEIAPKLLDNARQAGFAQLEDKPTGRDGVKVAEQLLEAETPEQAHEQVRALQLDAPSWPETPKPPEPTTKQEAARAPEAQRGADAQPSSPERARSPEAQRSADAQGASPQERARENPPDSPRPAATPDGRPPPPQQTPAAREAAEAAQTAADKRTRKRLGPQTLWNVLHLFRDDGAQDRKSAAQREEMNRLVIGMALALGLLTLIAMLVLLVR